MLDGQSFVLEQAVLHLDHARGRLDLCQGPSGNFFLEAAIVGHLGIGDLGRIFRFLDETPGFDVALPTLWDLSNFDFSAQNPMQFRASLFSLQHFPKRHNTLRAILVADEIGFGMTRMYQETAAGYRIENANCFMISYDRVKLLSWLASSTFKDCLQN